MQPASESVVIAAAIGFQVGRKVGAEGFIRAFNTHDLCQQACTMEPDFDVGGTVIEGDIAPTRCEISRVETVVILKANALARFNRACILPPKGAAMNAIAMATRALATVPCGGTARQWLLPAHRAPGRGGTTRAPNYASLRLWLFSAGLALSGCAVTSRHNQLIRQRDAFVVAFQAEIHRDQIKIEAGEDGICVRMSDDLLYIPGSVELDSRGQAVLSKVAHQLAGLTTYDYEIDVVGHTDNKPVAEKLVKSYATNWELAGARAAVVVRF